MATILKRAIKDFAIGAGASLGHKIASGDAKIISTEQDYKLGDEIMLQYGNVVSLDLKLIEKLASGLPRSLIFTRLEAGESTDNNEPLVYNLDFGMPNKGKAQFTAKPDILEGIDGMPIIRGKNVEFAADLIGTDTTSLTALESKKGKNLWLKLTTAGGSLWKIKNIMLTYRADYGFSQSDNPVHVVSLKKYVDKISDALVVPADLTLLGTLEATEGSLQNLHLLTADGKNHTLAGVIYALGCTLDFSYNGKPTWDITASRYAANIADVYSYI